MPRDIFLLIKLEGVFSAHWAIYIPTHTNPSNGKLLHVSDVLEVEFVRNYNIPAADDPGKLLVLLGQIDDSNENSIYDTLGNSNSPFTKDQDPKDKIERLASGTVVPGSTHVSTVLVLPPEQVELTT